MAALKAERERQGLHTDDITNQLREIFDYTMTPDQYKACEIGLTKRVPFIVIAAVGHLLQMPSEMIMPSHDSNLYRDIER